MVYPGEGPGGPAPPLFLDQNEARRAQKKIFFGGEVWDSFVIDCYTGYFPFYDGSIVSGAVEKKCEFMNQCAAENYNA